jgi:hypothetical protein
MTMRRRQAAKRSRTPTGARRHAPRLLLAGLLGLASGFVIACGASNRGLIPLSSAGPLQNDFEAVRKAAEAGNGNCTATEAALLKLAEDFSALPATVDANLRNTLRQGIDNLRSRSLALCTQPLGGTTTASPKTPTTTTTTPPTTVPTTTTTTPTTPTTETPGESGGTGGGTPAPGGEAAPGTGGEQAGSELGESRSGGASGESGATGGQVGGK